MNPANNARLSYGSLSEAAAKLPVPANVALKDPKQFKVIGKSIKRLDTRDKVNGKAKFGLDASVPGMVYAVLARCPVFGGKVASFDASKAKAVPGVKNVVQVPQGVAVIGENTWAAMQGRKVLEVKWDEGPVASVNSAGISRMFADYAQQPGTMAKKTGDAEQALAGAAKKFEAVYEAPYQSHSPMEPMNCTAVVRSDGCEIWAPTQMQAGGRSAAAQITGLKPEQVKLNTLFMGGGFGRRGGVDYIAEAVEIAKTMPGVPVKLTWSREDDMQHDLYRPASYVKFSGGVDAEGWPVALTAQVSRAPRFSADSPARSIPPRSRAFIRLNTRFPIFRWTGERPIPASRQPSGAPWDTHKTRSSLKHLWMSLRPPAARTRWNCGVACWANRRGFSPCSIRLPKSRTGARRPPDGTRAWHLSITSAVSPPWLPRFQSTRASSKYTAWFAPSIAGIS